MEPLSHERAGNIALTFTQSPMGGAQRACDRSNKMPTIFGAESMRESTLEPSVLGSVIPSLDPAPRDPPRNNAFFGVDSTPSPAAGAGAKRLRPAAAPAVTGRPSAPVSDKDGPREWAGGVAAAAAGEGAGWAVAAAGPGAGAGLIGGVVPGKQEEAEVAKRKRSRLKHGLRVLLRGTSRCGKTTILWDYCHRAAMAGYRVVLVCLKKYEGEELLNLPRSMRASRDPGGGDELRGWEAPALGRISIKYVRSREDLTWYLASLHTLKRKQWPTVIAVDDLDKVIEASAGGHGDGGIGAAALRILALLQDTAEFFDESRAGTLSAAAAAASSATAGAAAPSDVGGTPTATTNATLAPQQARERAGGGGEATTSSPPLPSGNLDLGGGDVARTPGEAGSRAEDGLVGGGQDEAVAVRVLRPRGCKSAEYDRAGLLLVETRPHHHHCAAAPF
eukprot:g12107.t1